MTKRFLFMLMLGQLYAPSVWAASSTSTMSPTGSILKMALGLVVVLAVMALVSWGVKHMMPGVNGQASAIRVVGGVSVGSRERVVVVQVADRWLVVGVAPGQVSGIANLEVGTPVMLPSTHGSTGQNDHGQASAQLAVHPIMQPLVKPFSEWLRKSAEKAQGMKGGSGHAKE